VSYSILGSFDQALRWYRRALRLDPHNPFARSNIAGVYSSLGEREVADRWYRDALALQDPVGRQAANHRASLEQLHGRPEPALAIWEEFVERVPTSAATRYLAAVQAYRARAFERALVHAEEALRITPGGGHPRVGWLHGFSLVKTGRESEGRAVLQRTITLYESLISAGADHPVAIVDLAVMHATLGDLEEALIWLQRAYDGGFRGQLIAVDAPGLDPLRGDPRFEEIMARIAADVEEMRLRVEAEERAAGLR